MKLSSLQAYCLDEMGIERFVSRHAHEEVASLKSYWIIYPKNQDPNLEQQNEKLLENILNALSWEQKDIFYYDLSVALAGEAKLGPAICGLWFGEETELFREMASNNTMVLLPALESLHENVALKRETWNKIKQFKV